MKTEKTIYVVLAGLMVLFILSNILSAFAPNYFGLLVNRVITGLVQGPLYGIGAVMASNLISEKMAAGLTLANVLRVPGSTWIGLQHGKETTFLTVVAFGLVAKSCLSSVFKSTGHGEPQSKQANS